MCQCNMKVNPKVLKTNDKAIIPTKNKADSGYDLYGIYNEKVLVHRPHEVMIFSTGIKVAFNPYYTCLFRERGSTAIRNMQVRAGVVEGNFRGEYKIILSNGNEYLDILYVSEDYTINDIVNAMDDVYPNYGYKGADFNINKLTIIKDELNREILYDSEYCIELSYIYSQTKAIAQMLFIKKEDDELIEVDEVVFSTFDSKRGNGMFGSSNK